MPTLIVKEIINDVVVDNCCGERFFSENIIMLHRCMLRNVAGKNALSCNLLIINDGVTGLAKGFLQVSVGSQLSNERIKVTEKKVQF